MSNDEKIEIATRMLTEMIELAQEQDRKHKVRALAEGQGEQTLGESWYVFHLKALKELFEDGTI